MALLNNITNFFPSSFLSKNVIPSTLGEDLSLCDTGNIIFHWADFHETCDAIKTRMLNDEELRADFETREKGLQKLAQIPVWIRTSNKIFQSNMYEIYEKFILDQSKFIGGLDPFGPLELSLISGTGPFKMMAIAECFNAATYRDFVLVYLLRGKLPRRDFRLRLKSKILMEYGENFSSASLINLEQITTRGLLLSIDAEQLMKTPSMKGQVRLLLDTKCLDEAIGKSMGDLSAHLSQYAFNLMYSSSKEDGIEIPFNDVKIQSSFDFLKNKKAYLFLSSNVLKENNPKAFKSLMNFVDYTRKLAREHYGVDLEEKSA